jgi:hypothetical protein
MNIIHTTLPAILQGKVDFNKYSATIADGAVFADLAALAADAAHFNPNFVFVASDYDLVQGGRRVVSRFDVFERNQPVGKIGIENRYHRGNYGTAYCVTSNNIKGRRSNSIASKHMKVAMKAIKDSFKTAPLDERGEEIRKAVEYKLERIARNAASHVTSSMANAAVDVLTFFKDYDSLPEKPSTLPPTVTRKLSTEWRSRLDDMRIATSVLDKFSARQGACVLIERDGTLSTYDLATDVLTECKSTYDLPPYYQEKITILKVMGESQPVEHIGIKFEDSDHTHGIRRELEYFFLVAGETHTTC